MYTKLQYSMYTVQYKLNNVMLSGFSKFEPLTTILRKDDILQFENIVNFFMLMNREINHKSHFFEKLIY